MSDNARDFGGESGTTRDDWTLEDWNLAYDEAVQWRDWPMCDVLLEERAQQSWWTPDEATLVNPRGE